MFASVIYSLRFCWFVTYCLCRHQCHVRGHPQ